MAFMHSKTALTLENLQILDYLKYTDSNGIQSNIDIAQQGNKLIIIDDEMPILEGFDTALVTDDGALKVVASSATTGEINLADVKKVIFTQKV